MKREEQTILETLTLRNYKYCYGLRIIKQCRIKDFLINIIKLDLES